MIFVDNILNFAGANLGEYGVIEKIERTFASPIELNSKKIMGKNGELYRNKTMGALYIDVYLRIFDDVNVNELMNLIFRDTNYDSLKALNFKNSKVWYDATISNYEIVESFRKTYRLIKLTFYVPSGSGRSRHRVKKFNFTSGVIRLDGNLPTYPIFTFQSASNIISGSSNKGGMVKVIGGNLATFVLDFEKETLVAGGKLFMNRIDWSSKFFMIYDGMTLESQVPCRLEYYERYAYDLVT